MEKHKTHEKHMLVYFLTFLKTDFKKIAGGQDVG